MPTRAVLIVMSCTALVLTAAGKPDGNRLAYLDGDDPYYPGLNFPKLTTPQWVGEAGVEAAVVLAIDDMRDPAKYEAFLRPILNRLKAIDGRAPVSIMTNQVKPDDPRLGSWIKEGLNLDVHTLTHPCPLLQKGDFKAAFDTVNGCIDLLNQVPGNRPVAFRMPCCDSLNTPSPRFFSEIFSSTRSAPGGFTGVFDLSQKTGHFLTIDSSVFNVLTPADPSLPRGLVEDQDGGEKFRKYLPFKSFVNTIENYPYPYVIGRLCWEFPCVVPSDWEAQHLQKPNNPRTVEDLKAALDAVVLKQGVFNLVFHPHGWIKSEQVVELIDHAVAKHGKKVKFLNFREAQERLDKHLLRGEPLRDGRGVDNGVRLLDLDNDGFMDVVVGNERKHETRRWDPRERLWRVGAFPADVGYQYGRVKKWNVAPAVRFGVVRPDGKASMLANLKGAPVDGPSVVGAWQFDGDRWIEDPGLLSARVKPRGDDGDEEVRTGDRERGDRGTRLLDIDGDGVCELLLANDAESAIFSWKGGRWERLPFRFPEGAYLTDRRVAIPTGEDRKIVEGEGFNSGSSVRFVDLDEDGSLDLVFSDDWAYGVFLFGSMESGWSRRVASGKSGDPGALPKILRTTADPDRGLDLADNGFWIHSRHLWWQNEDTAKLPDLVDRRSFNELLKDVPARGKSADAALKSIRVRPGFKVELAASEPLVLDPIAFDWGADGRLWVVEMGDYPLGVDGKGKPGGQVRVLQDTDRDGRYDKATVFLDGLGFPTGLMPWRNGIIVACAPEILYAEDRDGDGKADLRQVLFTGFVPGNQQHRLNGFELGLDGWVYGANGDSGGEVRSSKTGKSVSIRGRDFRFKPDTGEFESESGMTQFGRHRDDWGRWFGNNNPNWGWTYMLSESDLRRNPAFAAPDPRKTLEADTRLHPVSYTAPRFNDPGAAGRVTSANSPTPYRDDLFGPHFARSLFVSEPVHNLVHRMVLEDDGPGLKGARAVGEADREFLASSDPWFRPTMLKTGPDGALWVADMDRAVIEHPEWIPDAWEAKLDLRAGSDRGRIIRVVPVDKKPRPIPDLSRLDTSGLVAALESPNGWQRDTAHRLLLHRREPSAIEPLRRLARDSENPKARVQALWLLENLGALTAEDLTRVIAAAGPALRNTIKLSEPFLPTAADLSQAVRNQADHASAEVRFQVALSMGSWDDSRAGEALARIARSDGNDPWFRAAILSAKPSIAAHTLKALFADGAGPPPAGLVEPLFAMLSRSRGREGLLGLVETVGKASGSKARYGPWQFSALSGLLDASKRAGEPLSRWAGAGQGEAMSAAVARLDALIPAAHEVAADSNAPEDDRVAALGLVGRDPRHRDTERALLATLLKPQVPDRIQRAALAASARGADPRLPEPLLAGWKGHSPGVRTGVLDTLLSRDEWSSALLFSLEDKCVPPTEIGPAHRRRLLDHASKDFRERARAVFGPDQGTRLAVVADYRDALRTPGEPVAGAGVFKRLCASCHKFGGVGFDVGPDLASLNDRSPEAFLLAILHPNRAVEAKYTNFTIHTTDGRVLTGLVASETGGSITLRRQEGKDDVVPRAEIEAMTGSGQSMMPEGLEKDLSKRDLTDLIAFLNKRSQ